MKNIHRHQSANGHLALKYKKLNWSQDEDGSLCARGNSGNHYTIDYAPTSKGYELFIQCPNSLNCDSVNVSRIITAQAIANLIDNDHE